MIKIVLAFISLFIIFFTGIDMFRKMTNKEKLSLAKITAYSLGISALVVVVMVGIVILF